MIHMELEKEPDEKELENFWVRQIYHILRERTASEKERRMFIESMKLLQGRIQD